MKIKNKKKMFLSLMVLLIGIASACQRSGENTNKPVSPTNANTKSGEVAIEISPEALGKEWLQDRAGTDNKYKGKTLSISGEVWVAEQIGDQVFVHFIGVPVPSDAKTGGAKINLHHHADCGCSPSHRGDEGKRANDKGNESKRSQDAADEVDRQRRLLEQ